MSWDDLPDYAKLLICAVGGALLLILIMIVMCQYIKLGKKRNKNGVQSSENSESDEKELADISPRRHLPKSTSGEKKWATQSIRSRTSLSSSGSEGYGSLKGPRYPTKREMKRSAEPPLDEIQFLQVPEIIQEPGTLGSVRFSLSHEKEGERLRLHVISAHDLQARLFGGKPNPYVRVRLHKSGKEKPDFKFETKIQTRTNNPTFDETYEAPVKTSNLSRYTLRLVICDHHRLGQADIAGEAELRLKGEDLETGAEREMILEPSTQIPYGELLISLCYLPTSERLHIAILRATGFTDAQEPCVKVSLVFADKSASKRRIASTQQRLGVVFEESMFFEAPRGKMERIKLLVVVMGETTALAADEADADEAGAPESPRREIGKILLGRNCSHNAHVHWEEITHVPRIPIAQWYPIFQEF